MQRLRPGPRRWEPRIEHGIWSAEQGLGMQTDRGGAQSARLSAEADYAGRGEAPKLLRIASLRREGRFYISKARHGTM